eukprot:488611_1
MSIDLKALKGVESYAKDIVNGYLRMKAQKFELDVIPELIYFICLGYYYMSEYFYKTGERIKISPDHCTIQSLATGNPAGSTCYGSTIINSTEKYIYKWRFKIHIFNGYIGIDKADCKNINANFATIRTSRRSASVYPYESQNQPSNYAYSAYRRKWRNGNSENYGVYYGCGDIVEMRLDMYRGELSYAINDKYQGIAYNGIERRDNIKYRMAVYMSERGTDWKSGDCITLFSYICEEPNQNSFF